MTSPEKKKKKTATKKKQSLQPSLVVSPTPESTPNPSLPDDLLLSCFARVSKLYYPTLSLVSKSFRYLLSSPELYETRSIIGRNKASCLYVCLHFDSEPNPRWFTLCRKPHKTDEKNSSSKRKKKKSSGYALAQIPIPNAPEAHWEGLAAVIGSDIYAIGGPINCKPSSSVSILDCRSHTWREAPDMSVERSDPAVNVYNGKIYVGGGCEEINSSWMEVYDPKTETWEPLLCPLAEKCKSSHIDKSALIQEVIFMFGYKGVMYDLIEDSWSSIGDNTYINLGWESNSYCVIDDVIYCYKRGDGFKWYDTKVHTWKYLKGMVGLPKFAQWCLAKVADYGGKMVVLWNKYLPSSGYTQRVIWCSEISLERCVDGEEEQIWGIVEWFGDVLTVPASFDLLKVISVTL